MNDKKSTTIMKAAVAVAAFLMMLALVVALHIDQNRQIAELRRDMRTLTAGGTMQHHDYIYLRNELQELNARLDEIIASR